MPFYEDVEMMIQFESRARQRGYQAIAGVDEAGRGPLAGPVVAAAVILPPDYRHPEINDSKQLTPGKRERLYEVIKADAIAVGIGVIEASVIDRMNILRATLMAMRDAVLDLSPPPDFVLVDGRNTIDVRTPQEAIIGGDGKSLSIAAASIIAKVSRDRIMEIYHRQFPQYNFLKNKGYGTGEHRDAILRCGPCKIHRLSFAVKSSVDRQPSLL